MTGEHFHIKLVMICPSIGISVLRQRRGKGTGLEPAQRPQGRPAYNPGRPFNLAIALGRQQQKRPQAAVIAGS